MSESPISVLFKIYSEWQLYACNLCLETKKTHDNMPLMDTIMRQYKIGLGFIFCFSFFVKVLCYNSVAFFCAYGLQC